MVPNLIAALVLGSMGSLIAQNLDNVRSSFPSDAKSFVTKFDPAELRQDALIFNFKSQASFDFNDFEGTDFLKNPIPYQKILVSTEKTIPYKISGENLRVGIQKIAELYRNSGGNRPDLDCAPIAIGLENRIKQDLSSVLELVEREISTNSDCACEIVKSALIATEADTQLVVVIVETAINASPENARIISQCAIAIAPDAIAEIQALLAKLYPDSGEEGSSSKSAKGSKSAKDGLDPEDPANLKLGKDKKDGNSAFIISEIDIPRIPTNIPTIVFPLPVTDVNPGPPPRSPSP